MDALSPLARAFINRFQGGFPLAGRPYFRVAAKLGTTEATLISLISDLLESGHLSRFGPLYDAARLGGALTLAALRVPEERFDVVAAQVNALPEVAHNYRREHALNMWFVVAADSSENVALALRRIERRTGLKVYDFPKQREFYLGLWLRLGEDGGVDTIPAPESSPAPAGEPTGELDRKIIAATQHGLPLTVEPCETVADAVGVGPQQVLERLEQMLSTGVIRRVGAVPNHYRLGLRANGMTVWDVPDERVAELGRRIGRLPFVSHCYQRPRHPGVWSYNLFAMVHGTDRGSVRDKVTRIAGELGDHCRTHDCLFSNAVLKKTGLRLAA